MKTFLIIVIAVGAVMAVLVFKNKPAMAPENGSASESPVYCTQDAKQCSDGSYVGRQGPNCEFAPCPTISVKASPSSSVTPKPQTVTITFANGIAAPDMVSIHVGDTVKFVNNDNVPRWPASGIHPTHQICPGFDSLHGLNKGESYSFTFREAKTCPWHDHLQPSVNGKIVVE